MNLRHPRTDWTFRHRRYGGGNDSERRFGDLDNSGEEAGPSSSRQRAFDDKNDPQTSGRHSPSDNFYENGGRHPFGMRRASGQVALGSQLHGRNHTQVLYPYPGTPIGFRARSPSGNDRQTSTSANPSWSRYDSQDFDSVEDRPPSPEDSNMSPESLVMMLHAPDLVAQLRRVEIRDLVVGGIPRSDLTWEVGTRLWISSNNLDRTQSANPNSQQLHGSRRAQTVGGSTPIGSPVSGEST